MPKARSTKRASAARSVRAAKPRGKAKAAGKVRAKAVGKRGGADSNSGGGTRRFQAFCRTLTGATEDIKWGDNLIFSVGKRMFAGFDTDGSKYMAFKCDEQEFLRLVQIKGIIPAPYMAKSMWVSVRDLKALKPDEVERLLRRAHEIILASLPMRTQVLIARGEWTPY